MPKGRRRLTCFHEAGHCLARWYLGFHTDSVEVLSVKQVTTGALAKDRRGRDVRCEGLVSGYDIHFVLPPSLVSGKFQSKGRNRAEMSLLALAAGVAAEARYRKLALLVCALEGGGEDWQAAKVVAADWLPDDAGALDIAHKRARALVASPTAWGAITSVAELLLQTGRLSGDAIDHCFLQAFGGSKAVYGAWDDLWPPTIMHLKAGFVPSPQMASSGCFPAAETAGPAALT